MAAAKKKGIDLMLLMGSPKKKGTMSDTGDDMPGKSDSTAEEGGEDYGGEFESAATKALGTDDPERIDAFWQAVKACMDRGE